MSIDEMQKYIQFIFDQMEKIKAFLVMSNTIARNAEEQNARMRRFCH